MFQELSDRCRRRIAQDEQVLWCGRGRPKVDCGGTVVTSIFSAILICAYFSPLGIHIGRWMGLDLGTLNAEIMVWVAMFVFGFVITMVISLLCHRVSTGRAVWVITNSRVYWFLGPFTRVWNYDLQLPAPRWNELADGGRRFVFGQHYIQTKTHGYFVEDAIESVPPEDVPYVETALMQLAKFREAAMNVRYAENLEKARRYITTVRDEMTGRIDIVFRDNHPASATLVFILVMAFACGVFLLPFAGYGIPLSQYALVAVAALISGCPCLYFICGCRKFSLCSGKGTYFNGVCGIGIRRRFEYDSSTRISKGKSNIKTRGVFHSAIVIRTPRGDVKTFSHREDAVVDELIRLMQKAVCGWI